MERFRSDLDSLLSEHAKETASVVAKPEEPKYLTREEWSLLKVGSVVKYHLHDHPIQFKVIEPISMSGWVWQEDGFTLVSTPDDPQPTPTKYLTEEEFKALKVGSEVAYKAREGLIYTFTGHRIGTAINGRYKASWGEGDACILFMPDSITLVSEPEPPQVPTPATDSELDQAFKFITAELKAMQQTGLYSEWATANAATRLSEAFFWVDQMKHGKKETP